MTANGDGNPSKIIPDGYTLQGYIAEVPGVSRAVSFVYRPVDPATRIRYGVRKRTANLRQDIGDEDRAIAVAFLDVEMAMANVSSWDFRNHLGMPVEKTAWAVFGHFTDYQHNRLLAIVCDGLPSDARPDQPTDKPPQQETGSLEDAEKNSATASVS